MRGHIDLREAKDRSIAAGAPASRVVRAEVASTTTQSTRVHAHFLGLEYRYTAIVGVNDRALPNSSAATPQKLDRL
ncbi:hypothetical protein [Streptomyces sp. NPDC005953]|uniref:hypothetical protein n=1 Tax=Streptomyces sp. NPDC005953 TaxID=3156719 RepID=UPI0033BFDAA8